MIELPTNPNETIDKSAFQKDLLRLMKKYHVVKVYPRENGVIFDFARAENGLYFSAEAYLFGKDGEPKDYNVIAVDINTTNPKE